LTEYLATTIGQRPDECPGSLESFEPVVLEASLDRRAWWERGEELGVFDVAPAQPAFQRFYRRSILSALVSAGSSGRWRTSVALGVGSCALLNRSTQDVLSFQRPRLHAAFHAADVLLRPLGNTIYVMPPYCVTEDDLAQVYDAIAVLKQLQYRVLVAAPDKITLESLPDRTPTCGLHPTTTLCAVEVAPSPVNGAIRDQASNFARKPNFAYIAANTAYRKCTKRELIPTAGDNPVHNHTAK
jgi:hypothetical protein